MKSWVSPPRVGTAPCHGFAPREEALSATAEQDVAALDLDHVLARRRAS